MNTKEQYQEALDYLYSYVDYSLSRTFRYKPEEFDLGRLRELMDVLGNPQEEYPIIHVAGTKGKGSVTAICQSVLRKGGYKVGMYTSPHLIDFNERIQINGDPISHKELIDIVDEIKPSVESIPKLTTFEITTALALLYFAREEVDAVVLEVGLGGRLDATNIVVPKVSVITSLSYDHTYILGNTLAEIAAEKGGIIKKGVPVVLAPQEDEARLVIEEICTEKSASLTLVGHHYLFAPISHSLDGQSFLVWPASEQGLVDEYIESGGIQEWEPTRLVIPLLGYHQVQNAATAYTALQIFSKVALALDAEAFREGFLNVYWPGRFQVLQRNPPVVVDSAHNRASSRKLRLALDDYFPGQGVVLVFGASEDKDIYGMFAALMPRVHRVIATKSFHPRAMDPDEIVEMAHQFGKQAKIVMDVADALDYGLKIAGNERMVLAAGSLFVAAGAIEAWNSRNNADIKLFGAREKV